MIGMPLTAANGEADDQLRLGTDFEADVVALAVMGNRLDHLALLIDLDRVEGLVLGRVLVLGDGVLEGAVDIGNPPGEDIHEAQEDRRLDLALDQIVDQGAQIDGLLGIGGRMDADIPLLVDREEIRPPVAEVIYFWRNRLLSSVP